VAIVLSLGIYGLGLYGISEAQVNAALEGIGGMGTIMAIINMILRSITSEPIDWGDGK
jgi:hypothetical protein